MNFDPDVHFPLVQICQELRRRAAGAGAQPLELAKLNNRRVLNAAQDAVIPAERINGRWYVRRADLDQVAEILGVLPKPRLGRPRKAVSSSNNEAMAAA